MHHPIRDDRNFPRSENCTFFPVSDLCPAKFRIGVLFESSSSPFRVLLAN